jgi:hypothetical protein
VYEIASALFVLSAAGIVRVGRRLQDRERAFGVLLVLLTGVNLFVYLPWQFREYHGLYGITAQARQTLQEADLHNALVVVRDESGWKDYAVAFAMNKPTLDGDVVYASDCGPLTGELLAHFSERAIYYFDGRTVQPYASPGGP